MRRSSSDLDQQVNVNLFPLGIPEVWCDLDQQVDLTRINPGISRVYNLVPFMLYLNGY